MAGLVTDLDGRGVGQRIKSLNPRFRKAIRHRGHSPNEQSANPEVFAIVGKMRPWFRALVLMATFTSLRWGELIALRRHLDLAAGFVKVEAAMTKVNGRLSPGPPKSAAGVREVGTIAAGVSRAITDGWQARTGTRRAQRPTAAVGTPPDATSSEPDDLVRRVRHPRDDTWDSSQLLS